MDGKMGFNGHPCTLRQCKHAHAQKMKMKNKSTKREKEIDTQQMQWHKTTHNHVVRDAEHDRKQEMHV